MNKHIGYFDFIRGLAIMMVVGIHTFPKCTWDDSSDWGLIVVRQILNCAVPIFLALSAFFLTKKNFRFLNCDLFFLEKTDTQSIYSMFNMVFTSIYIGYKEW